jgi:starch phosphorylase
MTHDEDLRWFEAFNGSTPYKRFEERPIAYFCAEYALANEIKTFSGGLGVLAGDMVREAQDRKLPLVAVGLYYHEGYLCEVKETGGKPVEFCVSIPPASVGLVLAVDGKGEPLRVRVPIQDKEVLVQAWMWRKDGLTVYLLDTDIEGNDTKDRMITNRLYVADKETRFKQEMVLGIGGLRMLEALNIHPSVYHLNEGHSAFLTLELIQHQMKERRIGFDEAKQFARRRTALTNHTLLPAGNETYSNDLAALHLARYADELGVPVAEMVKLGLVQESSVFSMTMLAFRMSAVINSVSRLHAKKAKEIWTDHPMVAVTNGVHLPTWDRVAKDISAKGAFWKRHQELKAELLATILEKTGRKWGTEELLLGWARRTVKYKRPLAILEDAKRFAAIARNADRPVRIIFSGHPHPSDEDGLKMLASLRAIVDGELSDVAAYLPGYDLESSKRLVSGCDIWLNTPVVGFEACGTSGMKAALNGALPVSTNDGWVAEAELFKVGWLLDDARVGTNALDILEKEIVPTYYARTSDGVPEPWEEYMRNSRDMITNQFSATRMLREYIETLYS